VAENGALRPVEGIDQCPQALGDERCRLSKHDRRQRKTGPRCALQVLRCHTHGEYFTIYPQGFTPYGRQRIAPASTGPEAAVGRRDRWASTMFEAAAQAAEGEVGVRDAGFDEGPSKPRHSTQRRRVHVAARLLGLATGDERRADSVAQALDLPGLDHRQARGRFAVAATLRERGLVILSVLERMPLSGGLERRLLCAGFLVGLWGQPALWNARTSRRVFLPCGTPPSIPPRSPPLASHENVPPSVQGPSSTVPIQ
jgi:hypothetical protein